MTGITTAQISALRLNAAEASDMLQVAICDIALHGEIDPKVDLDSASRDKLATAAWTQDTARAECARVIADAS